MIRTARFLMIAVMLALISTSWSASAQQPLIGSACTALPDVAESTPEPADNPQGEIGFIAYSRLTGYEFLLVDVATGDLTELSLNPPPTGGDWDIISNLSWSPNGNCLVFGAQIMDDGTATPYDLFVLNVDTAVITPITVNPGWDYLPAWSPAGGQIAYTTDEFGGFELALLDLESGVREPLTQTEGRTESIVTWNSSGDGVAFASTAETEHLQLYILDVTEPDPYQRLSFSDRAEFHPDVSPDDARLAFVGYDLDDDSMYTDLYMVEFATGDETSLVETEELFEYVPDWSPDGAYISFLRTNGDTPGLYIIPSEGGEEQLIVSAIELDRRVEFAAWRPPVE
jgi:Tol biopolymer transport system component